MTPQEINIMQCKVQANIANLYKELGQEVMVMLILGRLDEITSLNHYVDDLKRLEDRYSELKSLEEIKIGDTNEGEKRGNNRES
jgi:hypothetical protein